MPPALWPETINKAGPAMQLLHELRRLRRVDIRFVAPLTPFSQGLARGYPDCRGPARGRRAGKDPLASAPGAEHGPEVMRSPHGGTR